MIEPCGHTLHWIEDGVRLGGTQHGAVESVNGLTEFDVIAEECAERDAEILAREAQRAAEYMATLAGQPAPPYALSEIVEPAYIPCPEWDAPALLALFSHMRGNVQQAAEFVMALGDNQLRILAYGARDWVRLVETIWAERE